MVKVDLKHYYVFGNRYINQCEAFLLAQSVLLLSDDESFRARKFTLE